MDNVTLHAYLTTT